MESEGIHKVIKDALLIAEKEATKRSLAISDRDRMITEELEESC